MALADGADELSVCGGEHARRLESECAGDGNFALENAGVFVLGVEVA